MSAAPMISSQRYIDSQKVCKKALTFSVFKVSVVEMFLREKQYRVILDGHHNYAAAKIAGCEPKFVGPSKKVRRIMNSVGAKEFEKFIINNLTDSDWFYMDSGEVVEDLLGYHAKR